MTLPTPNRVLARTWAVPIPPVEIWAIHHASPIPAVVQTVLIVRREHVADGRARASAQLARTSLNGGLRLLISGLGPERIVP